MSGLPTALEISVNALLKEHFITSWKISADCDRNPVVILRLAEFTHLEAKDDTEVSAYSQQNFSRPPQFQYRRKPPSQIRRDKKRAEERRQQRSQTNQASNEEQDTFRHSCLFADTPPTGKHTLQKDTLEVSRSQPESQPASARAARGDSDTDSCERRQDGDSPAVCTVSASDSELSIDKLTEDCSTRDPTEEKAVEAGYKLDVIKECVSRITDRSVQNNIRDTSRNTSVGKVVQHDTDPDMLLCDSDDIVVVVSSKDGDSGIVRYLFVKQEQKYMRSDDLCMLSHLEQSKPIQRAEHEDRLKQSEKSLDILVNTMRYYLG